MVELRRAGPADADAIADVYLASFRAALSAVRLAHADQQVRDWIADHVVRETEAWVAMDGTDVVGMLSLAPGWVEHLYIAPGRQGQGIGRRLLDLAKDQANGSLELWTFQANKRARRFYERNGFVAVESTTGAGNEEREPDVRYRWDGRAQTRLD